MDMFFGKKKDESQLRMLTVFEQMNAELPEDANRRKTHLATNPCFNLAIGLVILLNSLMLGIEVDTGRGNKFEDRKGFFAMDFVFFVVFLAEMVVRQSQLSWSYFLDPWNFFDYILLVLNCGDLAVSISNDGSGGLKIAAAIRIVRLLRIVRNIKGLKLFYVLWMVIQGMMDSLRTMLWVALLLVIIVYCIGITLTTMVGQDDAAKAEWRYADQYFGKVPRSMWTIMQVITFDAWASDVARPLAEVSPTALAVIFLAIMLCSFGVLNVIVAVMVERTLAIAKESKDATGKILEKTEHELLKSMTDDFNKCDLDDGEVDLAEFQKLLQTPAFAYKLRLLGIQGDEADSLFELMDADGSGSVGPDEFITGLQKLKGPAKGQDLVTLISHAQMQCLRASKFADRVSKLSVKADEIQTRLNGVGKGITSELRLRKQAGERNDAVWRHAGQRQKVIGKLEETKTLSFPALSGYSYE